MTLSDVTIMFGEAVMLECDHALEITYPKGQNPTSFMVSTKDDSRYLVQVKEIPDNNSN
ncbi:MAG: hypothetical protein LBF12_00275 [Christensenellaceae bacterium]|jgi:hypothetical protein|nr:hypothetical protein [Christensenellaceae bacterium]